jgi:CRP/FNR family cyclic AMP-dependent transcriptional regulator
MIESKYLKDNMQNIQRLLDIPALKHFEIKNLAKLLRLSKIKEYEDGELIIKEGDMDPWLYFLLKGGVVIRKEGIEIVRIDKKGEIFGEMRVIDSLSRSASVYADGKTVCLGVNTSAHDKLSTDENKLDFLLLLYRIFAEYMSIRLRMTNDELVKAKTDSINYKTELERLKKKQTAPDGKTKVITRTIIK